MFSFFLSSLSLSSLSLLSLSSNRLALSFACTRFTKGFRRLIEFEEREKRKKRFPIFPGISNNRLREDSRYMNISEYRDNIFRMSRILEYFGFFLFSKSRQKLVFILFCNLKFKTLKLEKVVRSSSWKLFRRYWGSVYNYIVDRCFKNWCFCSVIIIAYPCKFVVSWMNGPIWEYYFAYWYIKGGN